MAAMTRLFSGARWWVRLAWHTRPFHSPGLVVTRRGSAFCARCGADLSL